MYRAEQLVCCDEASINNNNLERSRGRASLGERATVSTPYAPLDSRYSLIAAITLDGYIAARLLQGTTTGLDFNAFIMEEVVRCDALCRSPSHPNAYYACSFPR